MITNKTQIMIVFTFAVIFSLSLVSAITIYSGESVTLELEKPYEYYSVVGNTTEVILDITQNGNNVTITPSKYSLEDSYEIIFFDREKETITIYSSSGGGPSNTITKYVDRDVVEYVDREIIKKVPAEEVPEVSKKKFPIWVKVILIAGIIFGLVSYIYIVRRRYKNDESE